MPDTFKIGGIEHRKGEKCKSCFNGFPYNCTRCDGYIHGHQLQHGASMAVESACDICGEKWAQKG